MPNLTRGSNELSESIHDPAATQVAGTFHRNPLGCTSFWLSALSQIAQRKRVFSLLASRIEPKYVDSAITPVTDLVRPTYTMRRSVSLRSIDKLTVKGLPNFRGFDSYRSCLVIEALSKTTALSLIGVTFSVEHARLFQSQQLFANQMRNEN
jgi:hypothetical protein